MAVLVNNFDGGPDGTSITIINSGQVPGNDAFNGVTVTPPASSTMKYYDAVVLDRPTAEFVAEFIINGSGTPLCYVSWAAAMGTETDIWTRFYVRWPTLPTHATVDTPIFALYGPVFAVAAYMGNSGGVNDRPVILSQSGTRTAMTNAVTADQWVRFEFGAHMNDVASATSELRMYLDADSDEPTETIGQSGENYDTTGATSYRLGNGVGIPGSAPAFYSGWALSNEGWIGPAPFKAKGVPGIQPNAIAIHSDTR